MRYLLATLLCLLFSNANATDTTARKPVSLYSNPQIELGASAGFVYPGATESTLPEARAFRAGMFIIRANANFNKRNRNLYFVTGLQLGLMPFSTLGIVPAPPPSRKPLAEFRGEYLVTSLALVPGVQLQLPLNPTTKFCAGIGTGGLLIIHSYRTGVQKNILLEANIGLMADETTSVGLRIYHPYNGIEENTPFYNNSYMVTGILFDFRQNISGRGKKKSR